MSEKIFQSEITRSFNTLLTGPYFYYKIPDPQYGFGNYIRRPILRPFDCFLLYDDMVYIFELKYHNSILSFPFAKLAEHQEKNLKELSFMKFVKCAILINLHDKKKRTNQAYCLPIEYWLILKELAMIDNHKSFMVDKIQRFKIDRERFNRGYGWNILQTIDICNDSANLPE